MITSKKQSTGIKKVLFTLLCCFYFVLANAGIEKYNNRVKAASITGVPALFSVSDPQYATMASTPTWPQLFFNKSIKNRLTLGIDHALTSFINTPYTLSVNADITYYTYVGTAFVP